MLRRSARQIAANRKLWAAAWTAIALAVSILYLLPNTGPPGAYALDKLCHLLAFAGVSFPLRFMALGPHAYRVLIAFSIALGVSLEFAHAGVPGRVFSLLDVTANIVGIAAGLALGTRVSGALNAAASGAGDERGACARRRSNERL